MGAQIFVSYSRTDSARVAAHVAMLRAGGASLFMDTRSLEPGDMWEKVIQERLKASERVIVFWSKAAAKSSWVKREYEQAIALGIRVVPVRLDDTPLPRALASRQALQAAAEDQDRPHWFIGVLRSLAILVVSVGALAAALLASEASLAALYHDYTETRVFGARWAVVTLLWAGLAVVSWQALFGRSVKPWAIGTAVALVPAHQVAAVLWVGPLTKGLPLIGDAEYSYAYALGVVAGAAAGVFMALRLNSRARAQVATATVRAVMRRETDDTESGAVSSTP